MLYEVYRFKIHVPINKLTSSQTEKRCEAINHFYRLINCVLDNCASIYTCSCMQHIFYKLINEKMTFINFIIKFPVKIS